MERSAYFVEGPANLLHLVPPPPAPTVNEDTEGIQDPEVSRYVSQFVAQTRLLDSDDGSSYPFVIMMDAMSMPCLVPAAETTAYLVDSTRTVILYPTVGGPTGMGHTAAFIPLGDACAPEPVPVPVLVVSRHPERNAVLIAFSVHHGNYIGFVHERNIVNKS